MTRRDWITIHEIIRTGAWLMVLFLVMLILIGRFVVNGDHNPPVPTTTTVVHYIR